MTRPVLGSQKITPRFTRHFNFLCIDEFDDPILMVIFSKIMLWHLDTRHTICFNYFLYNIICNLNYKNNLNFKGIF